MPFACGYNLNTITCYLIDHLAQYLNGTNSNNLSTDTATDWLGGGIWRVEDIKKQGNIVYGRNILVMYYRVTTTSLKRAKKPI